MQNTRLDTILIYVKLLLELSIMIISIYIYINYFLINFGKKNNIEIY